MATYFSCKFFMVALILPMASTFSLILLFIYAFNSYADTYDVAVPSSIERKDAELFSSMAL
jgi:hypothetical protein